MTSVMAAPNSTQVHAVVESIETANEADDKTELGLTITQVKELFGPCFLHSNDKVRAFTYQTLKNLQPGETIIAELEYIGDARTGTFQLIRMID